MILSPDGEHLTQFKMGYDDAVYFVDPEGPRDLLWILAYGLLAVKQQNGPPIVTN